MTLLMAEVVGGLGVTRINGGQTFANKGFADCFDIADQDSLNAALQAYSGEVSILGQEAMGLKPGHAVLPHALGSRKPWKCSYLAEAFRGRPPRLADKLFWSFASFPLQPFPHIKIAIQKTVVLFASAIGRFYRRG